MPTESVSISCDDCVVTFVLGPPAASGIVVDVAEARAVRMLQRAGLVPELRFRRRVG